MCPCAYVPACRRLQIRFGGDDPDDSEGFDVEKLMTIDFEKIALVVFGCILSTPISAFLLFLFDRRSLSFKSMDDIGKDGVAELNSMVSSVEGSFSCGLVRIGGAEKKSVCERNIAAAKFASSVGVGVANDDMLKELGEMPKAGRNRVTAIQEADEADEALEQPIVELSEADMFKTRTRFVKLQALPQAAGIYLFNRDRKPSSKAEEMGCLNDAIVFPLLRTSRVYLFPVDVPGPIPDEEAVVSRQAESRSKRAARGIQIITPGYGSI